MCFPTKKPTVSFENSIGRTVSRDKFFLWESIFFNVHLLLSLQNAEWVFRIVRCSGINRPVELIRERAKDLYLPDFLHLQPTYGENTINFVDIGKYLSRWNYCSKKNMNIPVLNTRNTAEYFRLIIFFYRSYTFQYFPLNNKLGKANYIFQRIPLVFF